MHDRGPRRGFVLRRHENISRTLRRANGKDSAESGEDRDGTCVFIEPYAWPAGFPPFCGRPVLPGSPYCPAHAVRCAAPTTAVRR